MIDAAQRGGWPLIGWLCKCGRQLEHDKTLEWGCGACGTSHQPVEEWMRETAQLFDESEVSTPPQEPR